MRVATIRCVLAYRPSNCCASAVDRPDRPPRQPAARPVRGRYRGQVQREHLVGVGTSRTSLPAGRGRPSPARAARPARPGCPGRRRARRRPRGGRRGMAACSAMRPLGHLLAPPRQGRVRGDEGVPGEVHAARRYLCSRKASRTASGSIPRSARSASRTTFPVDLAIARRRTAGARRAPSAGPPRARSPSWTGPAPSPDAGRPARVDVDDRAQEVQRHRRALGGPAGSPGAAPRSEPARRSSRSSARSIPRPAARTRAAAGSARCSRRGTRRQLPGRSPHRRRGGPRR